MPEGKKESCAMFKRSKNSAIEESMLEKYTTTKEREEFGQMTKIDQAHYQS